MKQQDFETLHYEIAEFYNASPIGVNLLTIPDKTFKEILQGEKSTFTDKKNNVYTVYSNDKFTTVVVESDFTQAIVFGDADDVTKHIGITKYTGMPYDGDDYSRHMNALKETLSYLKYPINEKFPRGIRKLVAYRHGFVLNSKYQDMLTNVLTVLSTQATN